MLSDVGVSLHSIFILIIDLTRHFAGVRLLQRFNAHNATKQLLPYNQLHYYRHCLSQRGVSRQYHAGASGVQPDRARPIDGW